MKIARALGRGSGGKIREINKYRKLGGENGTVLKPRALIWNYVKPKMERKIE